MKTYDELNFADDFMFCKVMQDESICKDVLELLLNVKIKKINLVQKQRSIDERYLGHGIRLDVYVEGDNSVFDVEMQTSSRKNLGLRSRYYQSLIDIENLEKGQNYYKLRRSFIIFICLFDPFNMGLPLYSFKNRCKESDKVILNDKCEKYFYNVSCFKDCNNFKVRCFMEFLEKGESSGFDLVERIKAAVEKAKLNEEWRHEYMVMNLHLTDAKNEGLEEGREEGREEGMIEGRDLASRENAVNALRLNIDPETVCKITNLPLDVILELKEQVTSE